MSVTLKDWQEFRDRSQVAFVGQQRSELKRMTQAAVSAERLTGNPDWDYYLSIIQAEVERCEAAEDAAKESLVSPHGDPQEARVAAIRCRERANALRDAIRIPKAIIENGKGAGKMLRKYDLG